MKSVRRKDPAGSLPEGKVFQQDLRLGEAKRRGVVTLQVDAQLRKVSRCPGRVLFGVTGFELEHCESSRSRALRRSGWAGNAPRSTGRRCALPAERAAYGAPTAPGGRTATTPVLGSGRGLGGQPADFGGAGDSGGRLGCGFGSVPCQTSTEGVYAFALHGFGRGDRRDPKGGSKPVPATLAWLAVSQA